MKRLGHESVGEIAKLRFMLRRLRKLGAKRSVLGGVGTLSFQKRKVVINFTQGEKIIIVFIALTGHMQKESSGFIETAPNSDTGGESCQAQSRDLCDSHKCFWCDKRGGRESTVRRRFDEW